jgi:flavin reductase (DIM6/NTAB) family NADH-FMN oxidoreductase RutF
MASETEPDDDRDDPDNNVSGPASTEDVFLDIMSNFAASVTVVTSTHDGRDHGLTVSAFTSVSLDPPLVLVCVNYRSHSLEPMRESGGFTVNLLREAKGDVAMRFASKDDDKFDDLAILRPTFEAAGPGLPEQSYAILECRTIEAVKAGDHFIFVGHVEHAIRVDPGPPLMYWRRGFRTFDQGEDKPEE